MAQVQSHGIHEPSALPYLVQESILPQNPPVNSYTWQIYPVYDDEGNEITDEEILHTKTCVVWSRGGIVKRAFNLDVENEEILQSFVTRFPAAERRAQRHKLTEGVHLAKKNSSYHAKDSVSSSPGSSSHSEALALVVVLKSKAHIYLLTGDTHIVSIPFEVEKAFPTPRGCLLQRKASTSNARSTAISAPHNSFVSSPPGSSISRSQQVTLKTGSNSRPSLTLSPVVPKVTIPPRQNEFIPALFSLTDPQAELGIGVIQSSAHPVGGDNGQEFELAFNEEEEILYISRSNEIASASVPNLEPVLLAITWNAKSCLFTIWRVRYRSRENRDSTAKHKKVGHDAHGARRRSSNMLRANGSATPVGRGPGEARESLGPQLGRSFPDTYVSHRHDERKSSQVEILATELGPDFAEVGVQTRAARRVSSMLARTDLSMGPDRAPVSGYASNNPGRKSLNKTGHRGESTGDFRDRQSLGARPRSSFAGGSFLSNESSFLDAPIDRLLEGLNSGGEFEGFDKMMLEETKNDLPAEVVFSKVHSIPYTTPLPTAECSAAGFKVFLLAAPSEKSMTAGVSSLTACIMDTIRGELSVIKMEALLTLPNMSRRNKSKPVDDSQKDALKLSVTNVQRGTNFLDACKIRDGDRCCILVLTKERDGQVSLQLEFVGISSIRIDLPNPLLIHNPFSISPSHYLGSRSEIGRRRTLNGSLPSIAALANSCIRGQVDLIDLKSQAHRLQIRLEPRHSFIREILKTVEFVFRGKGGNGLFIMWMEVMRWLRGKTEIEALEWPAMVITLFGMIVPFLSDKHGKSRLVARQKKASLLRSSSGSAVDMSCWNEMMDQECAFGGTRPGWSTSPGWQWIGERSETIMSPAQPKTRGGRSKTADPPFDCKKSTSLIQFVSWAREFMQSPVGEQMLGPSGHLPTAPNKDRETRRTAIGSLLIALHLLWEEQRLDIRSSGLGCSDFQLVPILAQIGNWLNWPSWSARKGSYYYAEMDVEQQLFDENSITSLDLVPQPFDPPSIFDFIEVSFSQVQLRPFLTLLDVGGKKDSPDSKISRARAKSLTPRTLAVRKFFSRFASLANRQARVEWMWTCGLDSDVLATMPTGVAACLYDAISTCEASPPSSWSKPLLQFIGRDDLTMRSDAIGSSTTGKSHGIINHEAIRDYHAIGATTLDTEPSHSWDISSEADRQSVTRLIFREDRRFQDASRLVNQLRAPVAECNPEPDWTEADLLEAQRELVQLVTMRTLTVASGRGMINYSSRVPLLTEKVPIPAFTLQCQVRPSNVTFSADRAAFTEDRAVWAFFHNGTSAGLTISREARGIDTSWILFNKPLELTNRHAGFLLALGLNGHLKSLAKWVAFKYLTPKHTMTSIGLLLGLSASYLGTMDTLITRLLSVHVTRMLPPGAAELNLSPLTQTTGIMGIGILYCSSQHRRMSEVMLSEIENNDVEEGVALEQTLRDEGYRLAAGFALGLINLGQGKRLHALHDMNIMSRLLSIAISTKNVNLVHILDRATSGATIAFALIYLKTNDASVASKIDIPDTLHQFEYVRPDVFLLRTLARHLIMWDSIQPTRDFIRSSLPKAYRHRASLTETRTLNSEDMPFFNIMAGLCLALGLRFAGSGSSTARDLLTSYLDQFTRLTRLPALNYDSKLTRNAVRNCQDVTALATAAVMSGTGDLLVFRRLRSLHGRQDADTPYGSHLAAHMAIGILFLGGGTYTLGTSNLAVASLLCAFYPVFPTNVMDNQAHLQAFRHLWVLAAEPRCVVTRDVETGRPVSVPIIVVVKGEEKRMTAPCLVPELDLITEVRTEAKGYWDVRTDFSSSAATGDGDGAKRRIGFERNHFNIYLRRRAAYDAPWGSVFVSEMQALAEQGPAPSVGLSGVHTIHAAAATGPSSSSAGHDKSSNPFDWLWQLDVFRDLDVSERALVLPHALVGFGMSSSGGGEGNRFLRSTVVDTRLELEQGILADGKRGRVRGRVMERDRLWQLRLLFSWVEMLDREVEEEQGRMGRSDGNQAEAVVRGGGNWLRREVIEKLRWRVWRLGAGVVGDGEDEDDEADDDDGNNDDGSGAEGSSGME